MCILLSCVQLVVKINARGLPCWDFSLGQTRKHCCGNICDSRCFLKCIHVCPPVETLLRKQNLLPGKQKYFLANSETFDVSLCFSLMFPSVCPLWETLAGTMFPQQSFLVFPGLSSQFANPLSNSHFPVCNVYYCCFNVVFLELQLFYVTTNY